MLLEIYNVSDSVPNFRNNMDMAAHASFRMDALELQGYIKKKTNIFNANEWDTR